MEPKANSLLNETFCIDLTIKMTSLLYDTSWQQGTRKKGRAMTRTLSTIEKMLKGEFTADPRNSRFPIPEIPKGTPDGISYTHSGVVIEPEVARDWVLHRSVRRTLMEDAGLVHKEVVPNRKYLVAYAKELTRRLQQPGWWNKGTHQGAAFTPDGYILDAQHRLAACALSGVTITFPVAVNVPWNAWNDIDQNRNRAAHQMLDIPYANAATGTARHLLPLINGDWSSVYAYRGRECSEQVIEICLGWPYFAEDQSWMQEVFEAANEAHIPTGALGAVVTGSLASGVNPDEVQQFLNGLRPLTRPVEYITIGSDGGDPRQLVARFFDKEFRANGSRKSTSYDNERAYVGALRHAMNVWLARNQDHPVKITKIQKWSSNHDLPSIGKPSAIQDFHAKHVN